MQALNGQEKIIRLYSADGKDRLPYHYEHIVVEEKLSIPTEGEWGQNLLGEILVKEGEKFQGIPHGCKSCGIGETKTWVAIVQSDPEAWEFENS